MAKLHCALWPLRCTPPSTAFSFSHRRALSCSHPSYHDFKIHTEVIVHRSEGSGWYIRCLRGQPDIHRAAYSTQRREERTEHAGERRKQKVISVEMDKHIKHAKSGKWFNHRTVDTLSRFQEGWQDLLPLGQPLINWTCEWDKRVLYNKHGKRRWAVIGQ